MKKTPLISIVIPTYNHARFLGRALKSVIDQTYVNWEVIVIDNHSSDNTDEVMETFIDRRIRYLKIYNNGVIAASRNEGIRAAHGEWIAFLDSDDWWTVDKLTVCFNAINDGVDFVYHYLEIVSDKPRFLRPRLMKTPQVTVPVVMDLIINGNTINNSSVVVRKKLLSAIGGINEDIKIIASEDYDTWLRIAKLTNNFLCVQHKLGFYGVHSSNTSSIAQKNMSVADRIVIANFGNLLDHRQKVKVEARFNYAKGRFNYFNGNYRQAIANLSHVLFHHRNFSFRLKALISLLNLLIFKLPQLLLHKLFS